MMNQEGKRQKISRIQNYMFHDHSFNSKLKVSEEKNKAGIYQGISREKNNCVWFFTNFLSLPLTNEPSSLLNIFTFAKVKEKKK